MLNSSLRVLVLGKTETIHARRFAEELQRQGVNVAVVRTHRVTEDWPAAQYQPASLPPRFWNLPGTSLLGWVRHLDEVIRKFQPHFIHIHHDVWLLELMRWIRLRNAKIAFAAWGHFSVKELHSSSLRRGLAKVNLLVSDAVDVLDEIAPLAPKAARTIMRFGADLVNFTPGPADSTILANLGLASNGIYIFSPRSLRPNYNQETLIKSLPTILEKIPDAYLILKHHHVENYNDSVMYERNLRELAEEKGVWGRVIRIDHVPYEAMLHLYRVSRVAVSIPLEDGFPATIFEAMATGCPLVLSNDGSYVDVVVDGKNALCVEPQNVSQVSGSILKLLTDHSLAEQLREEGIKTAKSKGDLAKEVASLLLQYRALL